MYWLCLLPYSIFVLMIVIVIFQCLRSSTQKYADFTPQPEVNDEQFCALMPEVSEDVAMKVRDVLTDVSGWDREEIHPQTRIAEFEMW